MIPRSAAAGCGGMRLVGTPGTGISLLMALVPAPPAFRGVNAAPDYTRQHGGKFSLTTAATLTEAEVQTLRRGAR